MAEALLALDLGSQSIRALWLCQDGSRLQQRVSLPLPVTAEGEPCHLTGDDLWQTLAACVSQLMARAPEQKVTALAVTTQRATSIALDARGQPLTHLLRWNEARVATEIPPLPWYWRGLLGLAGAGQLVTSLQQRSPGNWLASQPGDAASRVAHWLQLSGYVNWRLTGKAHDCSAAQVGYLPFNYRHKRWRWPGHFLWPALSMPRNTLPKLLLPGALLGGLQESAAQKLGLPAGLPVIACAADKACEVLGSGGHQPNTTVLSLGTAVSAIRCQPRWRSVQRYQPAWPAATGAGYQMEIQLQRGLWLLRLLQQIDNGHLEDQPVPEKWLVNAPRDGAGLTRALDHAALPQWPALLTDHCRLHGAAATCGALLDGILDELVSAVDWLDMRAGSPAEQVLVAGGGSRSAALMQHLADRLGRDIEVCHDSQGEAVECGVLGAAMTAAVGAGWFRDYNEAMAAWAPSAKAVSPALPRAKERRQAAPPRHPLAPLPAERAQPTRG